MFLFTQESKYPDATIFKGVGGVPNCSRYFGGSTQETVSTWRHLPSGKLHRACIKESHPGPGSSHLQQGCSAELRMNSHSFDKQR